MEIIVRNLDQFADLIMVFFERSKLYAPQAGVLYPALLACLLYANFASRAEPTAPDVHAPTQAVVITDHLPHPR